MAAELGESSATSAVLHSTGKSQARWGVGPLAGWQRLLHQRGFLWRPLGQHLLKTPFYLFAILRPGTKVRDLGCPPDLVDQIIFLIIFGLRS